MKEISFSTYKYALVFIAFLSFFSCQIVLVPVYDAGIERQVANTARLNDLLYLEMLEDLPEHRTYARYREKYLAIEADINSIMNQQEVRNKAETLRELTAIIQSRFKEYRDAHKEKDVLTAAEIEIYNSYMAGRWKTLLRAEKNLKKR